MKKYITIIGMALLASCSNPIEEEMVTPGAEEWIPVITRSGSTAEPKEYAVTTRWWEGKSRMDYDAVLRVEGETSSWVTAPPQWPTDETKEIEVFALDCGGEFEYMVDILDDYRQYPYMVHYSKATAQNKPQKFTMKHLMAQLKVNILIHEEQEHAPSDAEIQIVRNGFITCGEADGDIYLDVTGRRARRVSLPAFTKVSTSTQSGYRNDDFECAPFIVVPQTLAAGTEFMTFMVEDVEYTFTPKTDMKLEPGKVHVLTLGVTYDEDHTGGSIPVVELIDVKVTPWKDGGTIDAGEAEDMTWKNGINKLTGEYEAAQLNADDYYEINNAGNLFWFAQQVNEGGEAGRYLNAILMQDIDLEGRPWTPIGTTGGTTSQSFRGIFDGNGKTICGLYVDAQRSALGFFGEVRKGVVKDFTIYGDVFLNGKYNYIGGVIGSACGIQGENGSTISGITSYVNVTLGEGTHGSNHVAGLIGYVNHNTTVERCMWLGELDLDIYRAQDGVGGLIGKANAQYVGTIRDCAAYGTIRTAYQSGSYVNPSDNQPFTNIFIGGIVSNSLAGATTNIENCIWAGNILDDTDLGENAHISAIGTLNGVGSVSNCYYYLGTVPYVTTHNAYDTTDKVFGVYHSQLVSGEIAAKLGDAWEQGEKYPILKK